MKEYNYDEVPYEKQRYEAVNKLTIVFKAEAMTLDPNATRCPICAANLCGIEINWKSQADFGQNHHGMVFDCGLAVQRLSFKRDWFIVTQCSKAMEILLKQKQVPPEFAKPQVPVPPKKLIKEDED